MPLQYICTFSRRISGSLDKMEEAGRNREEEEVCVLRELPWKRQLKGRWQRIAFPALMANCTDR